MVVNNVAYLHDDLEVEDYLLGHTQPGEGNEKTISTPSRDATIMQDG